MDQLRQNRQEQERRNVTRMVSDGQWIMAQEVDLKQLLGKFISEITIDNFEMIGR